MIYKETAEKNELKVNKKEIYRYLGYKGETPDTETLKAIDEVLDEMINSLNLSACFAVSNINIKDETIDFESFSVNSKNLSKNLKDCSKCVIFCATTGSEIDRIIFKYSRISPYRAVIAQAVGTELIEVWCDLLCQRIGEKVKSENLYLRPRFSPGYGDFNLEHQKDIFNILSPSKHIGVSLTESLIMTPSKSVSGVIGLGNKNIKCTLSGCETCENRETCDYSRG